MDIRIKLVRALLVLPLLAAGIALGSPSPTSAATVCDTGVDYKLGGTIKESITVPAGKLCALDGVTVRGGVTVEATGYFVAQNSEIRGSVTGGADSRVIIVNGVVRGRVTVAGAILAQIQPTELRGDVTITGVTYQVYLGPTTVRGGVTLNDNAETYVVGNIIETNLSCTGNTTVSNAGVPNTVGGTKTGDCANL